MSNLRRNMMAAGRRAAVDWESIARGMVDNITEFDIPSSLPVIPGNYQFAGRKLRSVVIDSNATSIGGYAFQACKKLTSVDIPDSVTTIGIGAFHQCSELTNVSFGNSVSIINQQAFRDSKITNITLPASLTKLDNLVFYHCPLENVVIMATTPPTLGTNVFSVNSTLFYVPDESVEAYKAANNWSALADRIKPLSELGGVND